jgi:hypothetical protein
LAYFPYASYLSSQYGDVVESRVIGVDDDDDDDVVDEGNSGHTSSSSSIEALSHAFTIAAVLTSLGQFLNSKLHHIMQLMRNSDRIANIKGSYSSSLNLSLPITTLLAVLFSMYYPPNIFLSPTSTKSTPHGDTTPSNSIAQKT